MSDQTDLTDTIGAKAGRDRDRHNARRLWIIDYPDRQVTLTWKDIPPEHRDRPADYVFSLATKGGGSYYELATGSRTE